jgi:glycosyl transferase, family 25
VRLISNGEQGAHELQQDAMISPQVFVIHVRGNSVREAYITGEMSRHGIAFEFVSDGNIEDLSPDIIEGFAVEPLKSDLPAVSCAYKHLLACSRILERELPFALILEDDIELSASFSAVLANSIAEAHRQGLTGYLISYESTGHHYIKRSELRPGKTLYRKPHGRYAGAYLIDACAAKRLVAYAGSEKCRLPLDWIHNELADKGLLAIFWCHPAVAEQQSHNGKLPSLLDGKEWGLLRRIVYTLQKLGRRLVFLIR